MSDLPAQGRYQQMHARPISGEELEVLGKTASAKWREGLYADLNEAVVATVKHAGLSPEQVKRVIEFTNTDAFLQEFKKEGSNDHKIIEFTGGPANPSEILKDLNDGGGGTVFDRGTLDYNHVPGDVKVSSVHDGALEMLFGAAPELPYAEPLQEAIDLREKLATLHDNMTSELSGLERMYGDLSEDLYQQVKQAALGGYSLGNIASVMAVGSPSDEHMKVAFQMLAPRLLSEGVFRNLQAATASMDKAASRCVPNGEHPLVVQTREFSECLSKLAHTRVARDEVHQSYGECTAYIKEADGALRKGYKHVTNAAKYVGEHAGDAAGWAKRVSLGGTGEGTKKVVRGVVSKAPAAAVAVGGLMAGRRIANNPTVNAVKYHIKKEFVPGSPEYEYESARERGEV